MQISPRLAIIINLILATIMALGTGDLGLPPGVSPDLAHTIVGWCAWLTIIINFAMHLLSSPTAGPLAGIMAKNVPPAVKSVIVLFILVGFAALPLAGCANLTDQQRANLQLEFNLAKQIGSDTVQIWCATSGIVYVIANDVNAESRVTNILAKNARAATDACPMIQQVSGVQVVLPGQVTATGTAPAAAASTTVTAPVAVSKS